MTRGEVVDQAVDILGDANLKSKADKWLNNVLLDLETRAFWRFLASTVTHTTGSSEDSKTLATLVSTPITDYSKGISVRNAVTNKDLRKLSKKEYNNVNDGTVGDITHFAISEDNATLYWFPKTDSADALEITNYSNITLPTTDITDLATTPGIPAKFHPGLIDGIIAWGTRYTDDAMHATAKAAYELSVSQMILDNADSYNIREQEVDKPSLNRNVNSASGQ